MLTEAPSLELQLLIEQQSLLIAILRADTARFQALAATIETEEPLPPLSQTKEQLLADILAGVP